MALSDRIAANRTRPQRGKPCSMGVLLDTLEGDERDALVTMLGDPEKRDGWTAGEIFDALLAEGHRVGYQTINRHRGRRCRCFWGEEAA